MVDNSCIFLHVAQKIILPQFNSQNVTCSIDIVYIQRVAMKQWFGSKGLNILTGSFHNNSIMISNLFKCLLILTVLCFRNIVVLHLHKLIFMGVFNHNVLNSGPFFFFFAWKKCHLTDTFLWHHFDSFFIQMIWQF